jgi:hypothetical protein
MSVREVIRFFHQFDSEEYLSILKNENGAVEHPSQPDAYMVDELPFYTPTEKEEYVYVLSFNHIPLSGVLIEALVNHPELVPDEVLIYWTIEQDLWLETTMGEVRGKNVDVDPDERKQKRDLSQIMSVFLWI